MITYTYDGTPDGFFCALARWVEDGCPQESALTCAETTTSLFSEILPVLSTPDQAELAVKKLTLRLGEEAVQKLLIIFLSEEKGLDDAALNYAKTVAVQGKYTVNNQAQPAVRTAEKIIHRVIFESHRLKGLIRFRLLADGTYYAPIEPDHLVLSMLLPHFKNRFSSQKWIIHDLRRGIAICHHQNKTCEILPLDAAPGLINPETGEINPAALDKEELAVQSLWQTFYEAIAIRERTNPRLQKTLMPKRYWKYLIEKPAR